MQKIMVSLIETGRSLEAGTGNPVRFVCAAENVDTPWWLPGSVLEYLRDRASFPDRLEPQDLDEGERPTHSVFIYKGAEYWVKG
jgi:hypothetical protein